jgi:hypothetical protein
MVKILPTKEPLQEIRIPQTGVCGSLRFCLPEGRQRERPNTTDGSLWMVKILPTESRRKSKAMEA